MSFSLRCPSVSVVLSHLASGLSPVGCAIPTLRISAALTRALWLMVFEDASERASAHRGRGLHIEMAQHCTCDAHVTCFAHVQDDPGA